jgi:hypothetical protein
MQGEPPHEAAELRSIRQKYSYPLAPGRFMENKTNHETERALLLKLREAVNSQEEFEYIEVQLATLRFQNTEVRHGPTGH